MQLFNKVLSFVFFYFGWGVCLERASNGDAYSGFFVVLVLLIIHLCFVKQKMMELLLILSVSLLGSLTDTFYALAGLIQYKATYSHFPWIAPLWVTSIWVLYGMCLNSSFTWLYNRWFLSTVLGGIGGIFSYIAGEKIGAISFMKGEVVVLGAVGLVWMFIFPLTLCYSQWMVHQFSEKKGITGNKSQ